jgi:hypothetical protein
METNRLNDYKKLKISEEKLRLLNKELKLPDVRLTPFARQRRIDAFNEAINLESGPSQEERKITILYEIDGYQIGVAKPGKEAAPDYKSVRHYKTGEKTNNPNDMLPLVLKDGKKIGKNLTFGEFFEEIEHLMHSDLFGLEILGTLLFRAAFMLDHKENNDGKWRYHIPEETIKELESRIPKIDNVPCRVFLHLTEILSLNEDVKVHTLGYEGFQYDYGRTNTLLTFVHLIAVLLNRRSLSKFAGSFARPPSGMAPIPKIKGIFDSFPLLSPELNV